MAAQSSILAWRIPLTKEVGCSPWSGKESHAQTQPPEVNWHVQSHGWQMPELSSDPKLWVLLLFFFFSQSSVAHASVHLKEKWP